MKTGRPPSHHENFHPRAAGVGMIPPAKPLQPISPKNPDLIKQPEGKQEAPVASLTLARGEQEKIAFPNLSCFCRCVKHNRQKVLVCSSLPGKFLPTPSRLNSALVLPGYLPHPDGSDSPLNNVARPNPAAPCHNEIET